MAGYLYASFRVWYGKERRLSGARALTFSSAVFDNDTWLDEWEIGENHRATNSMMPIRI